MSAPARTLVMLAVAGCVVTLARTESFSGAAFTATSVNPDNSFGAASTFPRFMATGTYSGNGADNRAITGLGFQPDVVIVKGNTNQTAAIRTATMPGDTTKPLAGATAMSADHIQSLTADGFTIGTNARVNASGVAYHWIALREEAGLLDLGSYVGNGSSRSIAGVGFQPEYVAVLSAGAQNAVQRFAGMSRSFRFDAETGTTTRVTSLDGDGFSVGSDSSVNSNLVPYFYLALNDVPGLVKVGSYTGTGADNRNLTGVGFQPQYVMVRANDTATARRGIHRPSSLAGDSSLNFSNAANAANLIQSLLADGFQLGSDGAVNASSVPYGYVAIRDR